MANILPFALGWTLHALVTGPRLLMFPAATGLAYRTIPSTSPASTINVAVALWICPPAIQPGCDVNGPIEVLGTIRSEMPSKSAQGPEVRSAWTIAMERVILVDDCDRPIGTENKLRAHQNGGRLHRAFSVFLYDRTGRMLLQRRSAGKYHFAGLWSNACCSHPRPEEATIDAARRRLREELGIEIELREALSFTYHAFDHASGLHEREFVHVLTGIYDGECRPDLDEIAEIRWVEDQMIQRETSATPERFTPWFLEALDLMGRRT